MNMKGPRELLWILIFLHCPPERLPERLLFSVHRSVGRSVGLSPGFPLPSSPWNSIGATRNVMGCKKKEQTAEAAAAGAAESLRPSFGSLD